MIGTVLARGTVHASLDLTLQDAAGDVRINADLARRLHAQLVRLAQEAGAPPPGIDAVLAIRGVVESADGADALDDGVIEAMKASLADALESLVGARRQEGAALSAILSEKLRTLHARALAAEALPRAASKR